MVKHLIVVSLLLINLSFSEEITFKDLTKLASEDLKKNIYLDKEIPNYKVEFDIVNYQKRGQVYEFYKVVLFEHDMYLQYNSKGDFYFVKKIVKEYEPKAPLPIHSDLIKHYYSYKIKNITNKDVNSVFSVFPQVKFIYLKQSDIILYTCTTKEHQEVNKMLIKADNSVISQSIKITLFTTNTTKLLNYGSNVRAFNLTLDSSLNGILSALKKGNSQKFNISDSASFGFTLFALQGRGVAEILQEPTLLLTNGIASSVNYVKNIAYQVSSTTRDNNSETTTDQLNYRDVGFRLKVLPKIKGNWVYLDLDLTSEELLTQDDNNIPVTQKISYKNSVKVYKGKPILLTGLKKATKKNELSGIPFLKDLPYIGELFKNRNNQNDEQNINILIEVI